MPKFLFLGSYTADAWSRMVETPPDRPAAAKELAEALGGTTECFTPSASSTW